MEVVTEVVWQQFADRLKQFILRHMRDEEAAQDILQDSFLKIHKGLPSLRRRDRLEAWVFQVTRNTIIDYYRRQKAEVELSEAKETVDNALLGDSTRDELASCLSPMVDQLPERYREAVLLAEYQGLTQAQVGQRLGLSLSGAKSRVQRGRSKLKKMLLDCCHFEFDRLGGVIDYQPRDSTCPVCTTGPQR